jgi:hypothetical protein
MMKRPFQADARTRRRRGVSALALAGLAIAGPALADGEAMSTAPGAAAPPPAAVAASPTTQPSETMVINLIRLLVKQGVITQAAADALIHQAEVETQQARAAAQASGAQASAVQAAPPPGVIRVPYVPEVVKNEIKDDVKKDVLAQAKAEGWANPHQLPGWLGQVQFFGDLRFRDEFDFYSSNNIPQLIDYNTFNNSGPTDINANTNPNGLPFLNTTQNRINQLSIRARLGVKFEPADWITLTFRLGSGQDNGPVSLTQLLGNDFGKKEIWLDQAYMTLSPGHLGSLNLGRMPNPFLHTDLLYDDNLEFDGVAAITSQRIGDEGFSVFGSGGAFPLGYVAGAFPTDSAVKVPDSTQWLFAIQAGAQYKPTETGWSVRGAVAFYDYDKVRGQLSAPCPIYDGTKQCSTDSSRPAYMHKGNTLFLIRDIIPNPASPLNYAQPQFAGLSYNYQEFDALAQFEAPLFGDIRGLITAEYVRNLAYDPSSWMNNPLLTPVTNFNVNPNGTNGNYQSGPNAYNVQLTIGYLNPVHRGDWNFQIGYKYIQPDALIDAFDSNDYHLGGTNAKGYYIIASYYFAKNTWVDGRWFSANEVYGPPLAIDVLQLELQTRF